MLCIKKCLYVEYVAVAVDVAAAVGVVVDVLVVQVQVLLHVLLDRQPRDRSDKAVHNETPE